MVFMLWLIPAFMAALFDSVIDVLTKKGLKNMDIYIVSFSLRFFALPFLLPLLFFIEIPSLGIGFFNALFISGLLNALATILYMRAIKQSDLSIAIPMMAFTPIFLVLTSPLLIGEFPNTFGLIGIILGVIGAYALNIKEIHNGYLAPFRALLKQPGPKLMLAAAVIWGITSNYDRIGIQNSSPIFWAIAVNVFMTLVMSVVLCFKPKENLRQIPANLNYLLPIGLFSALSYIAYIIAINFALVSYVISVKRTALIFGVLFGHFIFKEKGVKERLMGAAIMVLGIVLIALS